MKLVLLRCGICDAWYRPQAHSYHCPICAAMPMTINGRRKYFHLLQAKAIQVVRGCPRVVPVINLN